MRAWPFAVLLLAACAEPNREAVDPPPICAGECAVGARRCAASQVEFCADYDGDGCNEWGGAAACPAGQGCADGMCVSSCENECAAGAAVCGEGGVRTCVLDGAGCLRLGPPVACAADERCDNGGCVPADQACTDACPRMDDRRCGADGLERCGDFDADPCLEWSGARPCPGGTACAEGECVPRCADECMAGAARCMGAGVQTCGNFDADLCLEFGTSTPCGADERCDDGACVPADQACTPACEVEGGTICATDNTYQRCGQYDADACLDLSAPIECGPLERCEAGRCEAVCENECAAGAGRCVDGLRETCGNYDDDPCLEFGGALPCPAAEICDDGACTLDDAPCEDACLPGEQRCGAAGVERCAQVDADDCLEWSAAEPCPAGQVCVEAGQCELACFDTCQPGERACVGGAVVVCGNFDDDACREFGMPTPCPNGQSCVRGACAGACEDECQAGATRCSADGQGVERCGPSAADDCLRWSSPAPCDAREACDGGVCAPVCADECAIGDRRCNAAGFETCGDFDGDPCLEFGGGSPCGLGQRCVDGICAGGACQDECRQPNETECASPDAARVCGNFDGDRCLEWSAEQPCPPGTVCQGFDCAPGEAPPIVINELYYDAIGADGPTVFVELAGPSGTPLEGLRLVGINGANGERYQRIELVGSVGADGLFVIATPEADADLAGVVDQRAAAADFQNGPDAVLLLFGEQQIDAVAYGEDAPAVGEGAPAVDAPGGESLSRDANHTDSDDNARDFSAGPPTPGSP